MVVSARAPVDLASGPPEADAVVVEELAKRYAEVDAVRGVSFTVHAGETCGFHGQISGVPAATLRQRIDDVLEMVELSDRRGDVVRSSSGGMRRRVRAAG